MHVALFFSIFGEAPANNTLTSSPTTTLKRYRFGFNGKESDNEVSGNGNSYDYGFRIYNPRLGKFLSVDPLTGSYPWLTPYQFAANMPIVTIDVDGLEALIKIQSVTVSNTFLEIVQTDGIDAGIQYLLTYEKSKHRKKGIAWLRKATGDTEMSDDVVIVVDDAGLPADVTVLTLKYYKNYKAHYELQEYTLTVPEEIPVKKTFWETAVEGLEEFGEDLDEWINGTKGDADYPEKGGRKVREPTRWDMWKLKNVDNEIIQEVYRKYRGKENNGNMVHTVGYSGESIPVNADPKSDNNNSTSGG